MNSLLFPSDDCVSDIYVFAHTSTGAGSGTDNTHDIKVRANGNTYISGLNDLPRTDQAAPGKGDLWKLNVYSDFNVPGSTCIKKCDIQYIALEEDGNDGWRIDSVITVLKSGRNYEVATLDMDVDQWIDRDGDPRKQPRVVRRFELNLVIC